MRLTTKTVPIDKLVHDESNARIHGRDNLKAITESLNRFGQVRPLLATKDRVVIAGNGTLEAARKLGWTHLEVITLPWTDADKCRAYAIADNRTAELATWDKAMLGEQLADLSEQGVDMTALGFSLKSLGDDAPDGPASAGGPAQRAFRCPSCGFRWAIGDEEEVIPL